MAQPARRLKVAAVDENRGVARRQSFRHVVVGAGPAGVSAARELAGRAGHGSVALIGDEATIPYERPPLSKAMLRSQDEGIARIFSQNECNALGVVFFRGTSATQLHTDQRLLRTSRGEIEYGSLLLATGASARRLTVQGGDLPEVHYLRNEPDSLALRKRLAGRPRLVVIGGGFIGLEVAATASELGCPVEVVTMDSHLMSRCLPPQVAARVASYLTTKGLRMHFDAAVRAIEGHGSVSGVQLDGGRVLEAEVVVVGIGSVPNIALAIEAGIEVDDGIVVDHEWRSSDPNVFAAGDVARRRPADTAAGARGIRLESWEPAIEHGRLAALAMLGDAPGDPRTPWMWSDQFDLNIQISGNPEPGAHMILRDMPGALSAAYTDKERVTGAITLNDGPSMTLLRRAINEQRKVDTALLADTQVPLRKALGIGR